MPWLDDKVVLVTGAGRGIGREHALCCARHGAKVVVNDAGCQRDGTSDSDIATEVVEAIRAAGGQAVACCQAVGTFETGREIVETAVQHFGRLDVLINNAGILRDRTILNMTEEEWDQVLRVHLTGSFACLQAAARVMKQQGSGGRIINTSSSSGLLGNFGQANYGAAKAGIYALTRIAATELARYQITVNAIAPLAMTRMLETLPGTDPDQVAESLHPRRIAPLAAWLASDAASKVTGQIFGVEGNHIFVYRMMTSHGVTRMEPEPWTLNALDEAMEQIVHW